MCNINFGVLMSELLNQMSAIKNSEDVKKENIVDDIKECIDNSRYNIQEIDDQRPWGAFFRLVDSDADEFIGEFFPNIDPVEARLGRNDVELSPKILLVSPNQRLSWQYHHRRAERWMFITDGAYYKSLNDEMGEIVIAKAGESIQFAPTERHRLVGRKACYSFVAEIWQHTDPENPSGEDDNVRLSDATVEINSLD